MTEDHTVEQDLQENLESIRVDTLRILIYLCVPLVVAWFYLLLLRINRATSEIFPDVVPWLLFAGGLFAGWWFQRRELYKAARAMFFMAVLGAPVLVLGLTSLDTTFMAYALVLPVMISGLLISSRAPFWLATISMITLIGVAIIKGIAFGDFFEIFTGPILLGYLVALASWLGSRDLVSTVEWAMDSNRLAERRSQRLSASEARVARTLLELEGAYDTQTRLNDQLQQLNLDLDTARRAADEANTLKTRFLANMSHELRTPLNAIINFTQFMGKPRYGDLTPRQIELQERVLFNSEHLLGLINDILDLSKIEAGRMELYLESVDLAPMFNGVMATAVGLTKSKGLHLETEIAEDLPPVRGDKTRIRQILLNLLSNAAKFTDEGTLTLKAAQEEDMVRISISDTGSGIPPHELPLVFKEFHQVEQAASSKRQQGTGLGLPISRHLVELQHGTMWAESELGAGSTFSFTLPVAHSDETEVVVFDPREIAAQ